MLTKRGSLLLEFAFAFPRDFDALACAQATHRRHRYDTPTPWIICGALHESVPRGRRLERFGQQQMGFRRLETKSSQTLWWRKTDSNPRSLSGEEGDRTTPSLASNDFSRFKISKRPEQDRRGCGGQAAIRQRVGEG
jgi:hypothetical protein